MVKEPPEVAQSFLTEQVLIVAAPTPGTAISESNLVELSTNII
jgi:hypothetical protein